jgi:hypothetical protein
MNDARLAYLLTLYLLATIGGLAIAPLLAQSLGLFPRNTWGALLSLAAFVWCLWGSCYCVRKLETRSPDDHFEGLA